MTEEEASYNDFIATQRAGRRNAICGSLEGAGPAGSDAAAALLGADKPGEGRALDSD